MAQFNDGTQSPKLMIPPGQLLTYYGDLASGAIRPEDVRFEALTFRVTIDATGNPVFTTPKITVVARYNFAIRRIYAAVVNPEFAGAAAGFIRVNILEQGRNWNLFKVPVGLASVASGNASKPFEWDGVYICIPGTDLEAQWTIDQAFWSALVGATKFAEIVLSGDYIACGPQQP